MYVDEKMVLRADDASRPEGIKEIPRSCLGEQSNPRVLGIPTISLQ